MCRYACTVSQGRDLSDQFLHAGKALAVLQVVDLSSFGKSQTSSPVDGKQKYLHADPIFFPYVEYPVTFVVFAFLLLLPLECN